ncbi:Os10g0574901, partial [Oryza sativa Japonica Group]
PSSTPRCGQLVAPTTPTCIQATGNALFFSRCLLLYSSWHLHTCPKRDASYVSSALCRRNMPSRHKVLAPEMCA